MYLAVPNDIGQSSFSKAGLSHSRSQGLPLVLNHDLFDFVTQDDAHAFVTPGDDPALVTPGVDPGSISLAIHGSRIKSGMTAK